MKRLILIPLILLMLTSLIHGVENMPVDDIKTNYAIDGVILVPQKDFNASEKQPK